MKVVYDISILGKGSYIPAYRTGLFRVVENIACGVAASEECELTFCSTESLETLNKTIDYLKCRDCFENIPFLCTGISKDLSKYVNDLVNEINAKEQVGLFLKIYRRGLFSVNIMIGLFFSPIERKSLLGKDIFHSPFFAFPEESRNLNKLSRFLTVHDIIPLLYSCLLYTSPSPRD